MRAWCIVNVYACLINTLNTHTHTNTVQYSCSVHKIITGFINNVNSGRGVGRMWSAMGRALNAL